VKQGLYKADSKTSFSLYLDFGSQDEDITHLADSRLPSFDFSAVSTSLSIPSDLFELRHPSHRKVWSVAR